MGEAKVINTKELKPLVKKPRILKYKGLNLGMRVGKGFSELELKEVGLSIRDARRLGIPIDKRRRSKREENVKMLKEFLGLLIK